MKKIYRGWSALQVRIGLGYDLSTDRVICLDDAWQSFIQVHKEYNHLRHEGLCNKELYYNVFKKNHAAGASGFGSVTMRDGSNPYVEAEGVNRRAGDEASPSQSKGSSGKRNNEQSSRPDHLLMCMNIMTKMGIPLNKWTIMWHYFEAHPRVQRTFHQLPDEDRRDIIASVVKSQSPSDD
ncbi:hypothetical protein TIFTF001_023111 [Ficus carica]|uniref:Myb/SANT-like domain-containing protein n=1 Tax=Ficus carica TaxID=3494 RepID=A0AA88AUB1_FICCA|nr:hypothetical protein TIFTF001_023111 [Ficus carica]